MKEPFFIDFLLFSQAAARLLIKIDLVLLREMKKKTKDGFEILSKYRKSRAALISAVIAL